MSDGLIERLTLFGAGGTVSNPVALISEAVAELTQLRAQVAQIREIANRAAAVRAWSESDGPTSDEANARNALGEDILAVLVDVEEER